MLQLCCIIFQCSANNIDTMVSLFKKISFFSIMEYFLQHLLKCQVFALFKTKLVQYWNLIRTATKWANMKSWNCYAWKSYPTTNIMLLANHKQMVKTCTERKRYFHFLVWLKYKYLKCADVTFFFYIFIIEKRANKDFYFSTKDSKHAMAIKFIMVCYETNDYILLDLILGISRHIFIHAIQ